MNQESDQREDSLRISIDTQAKVDLCDSSRGGTSRCQKAVQADDHDMGTQPKLVPFGILDVLAGWFTIIMGTSSETSDFIVDGLERWWQSNQVHYSHIKQLVINLGKYSVLPSSSRKRVRNTTAKIVYNSHPWKAQQRHPPRQKRNPRWPVLIRGRRPLPSSG